MGFLKNIGKLVGGGGGAILGSPFVIVGKAINNKFITEIGKDIAKATYSTGELLGGTASGASDIIVGTITLDKKQINEGCSDIGSAGTQTAKGIYYGIKNTLNNGKALIGGILELNGEKTKEAAKKIIKTGIVATIAISVTDVIADGLFGNSNLDSPTDNDFDISNPENTVEVSTDLNGAGEISNSPDVAVIGDPVSDAQDFEQQEAPNSCAVATQREVIKSETGEDIPETILATEAESHGWYNPETGTKLEDLGKILTEHGIEVDAGYDHSVFDLINALQNKESIIVSVNATEIWYPEHDMFGNPLDKPSAGHAIRITGMQCDDMGNISVIANDPGIPDGAGKPIALDDFLNAWSDSNNYAVITA